jgi:hypothetical protein
MMNSRLDELAHRKETLLRRVTEERDELVQICRHLRESTRIVYLGTQLINLLKTHPILVAGVASLLVDSRLRKVPLWALMVAKSLLSGRAKRKRST